MNWKILTPWIIIAGVVGLFRFLHRLTVRRYARSTASDAIVALQEFLEGPTRDTWDLFTYYEIDDPYLESIRQRCLEVGRQFPPESEREDFCNAKGVEKIRSILNEVKSKIPDNTVNAPDKS